jgi:hypothetical protein
MIPPKYEAMKKILNSSAHLHLLLMLLLVTHLSAQEVIDGEKMKFFENQIVVNNSPEEVWKVLSAYGNISSFHSTIDDSIAINGSLQEAVLGSEREIQIPDGVNNIINKERIIELIDGVYYTYDVYESENFPIKKMQITYGVRLNFKGQTILFSKTYFKFNNALANRFLRKKLDRVNKDSLLAYKYYLETGERDTDIEVLRKRFIDNSKLEEDSNLLSSLSIN